ncbi:MAG: hypothetical protein HDR43_02380 [Mycoplasma sp.]|nr:hypothetical protein [Mycoplasma sp.]
MDNKSFKLKDTISDNENEIKRIERQNEDILKKISSYNKQKNNIENNPDNTATDADQMAELERKLELQGNSHQKNKGRINELINHNNNINALLSDIENLIKKQNHLNSFIDNFKKIYSDFKQEWTIINNDNNKKELINILKQECLRLKKEEENTFNTLTNIFNYENLEVNVIDKLLFK